ncbi:unnamed protein product [Callosobruchus maculatus]|uniref:Uncharacterized protein n=1 Tax=Callosobruchus maculatus TaxID=64391 RepID=A0A653BEE8_CALMS|nr:unnamed protein product [Callosobruchus maculatus]
MEKETIKSNNPEMVVEVSPDDLTSTNPISAVRKEPEATNNLMEPGKSSMGNNSPQDEATRNLESNLNRLHLNKEKLSGAQKRKRARERAIAKGEPILPRKQRTNRKPRAAKDLRPDKSGVDGAMGPPTATPPPSDQRDKGKKRVLSSGSTPSPSQNPKKIAKRDPAAPQPSKTSGASYSGVTSAIKMSVFVGPEPETKMTPLNRVPWYRKLSSRRSGNANLEKDPNSTTAKWNMAWSTYAALITMQWSG